MDTLATYEFRESLHYVTIGSLLLYLVYKIDILAIGKFRRFLLYVRCYETLFFWFCFLLLDWMMGNSFLSLEEVAQII